MWTVGWLTFWLQPHLEGHRYTISSRKEKLAIPYSFGLSYEKITLNRHMIKSNWIHSERCHFSEVLNNFILIEYYLEENFVGSILFLYQ